MHKSTQKIDHTYLTISVESLQCAISHLNPNGFDLADVREDLEDAIGCIQSFKKEQLGLDDDA